MRIGWVTRVVGVAFGSLLLGGCLSGQTGSPDCVEGPISCVCEPLLSAGTLLRVHVERVEAGQLEAVVDEVFASPDNTHNAEVGDRVGGSLLGRQPCASDTSPDLQVGNELLVLYTAGSTPQRSPALLDGLFSWAVPWGDTLSFGEGHELASSDISVMSSYESCIERFPAPPGPRCQDTIHAGPCSATPRASTHGGSAWAVLLGLFLVWGLRRFPALARRP